MLIRSHDLTREDLRYVGSSDPSLRREVAKRRRPHRHPTETVATATPLGLPTAPSPARPKHAN